MWFWDMVDVIYPLINDLNAVRVLSNIYGGM